MMPLDVRGKSQASWIVFLVGGFLGIVGVTPTVIDTISRVPPELPIIIKNQRIVWIGPRSLQSTSDGVVWTDTCPKVTISRYLVLKNGETVPVNGRVVSGPLKGMAQEPRYDLSITPQARDGSVINIDVPEWIHDRSELKYYLTTIKVPDDQPCKSGNTWNQALLQITIPQPPPPGRDVRDELPPPSEHDNRSELQR